MKTLQIFGLLAAVASAIPHPQLDKRHISDFVSRPTIQKRATPIAPKIVLINLFSFEADSFYGVPEFNLLAQNITVPGLSPLFPDVHCTADGSICQVVLGESEVNAAGSIMALALNPQFNLTKSYFISMGIAGVNPKVATLASVGFARFAISPGLQYEIDIRELNSSYSSGYVPYGTVLPAPAQYPTTIYGTEIFEVNANLRDKMMYLGSLAKLNDTSVAAAYRARYNETAARAAPSVLALDTATSDVYFSGYIISDNVANYTTLISNGTAVYGYTAQEDGAICSGLMRAALAGLVDYSRLVIIRSGSDFDRPPPGVSAIDHLRINDQGAFLPSLANLYLTFVQMQKDIITNWDSLYSGGIKPGNYLGDIFGTLKDMYGVPDFGPYPYFGVG